MGSTINMIDALIQKTIVNNNGVEDATHMCMGRKKFTDLIREYAFLYDVEYPTTKDLEETIGLKILVTGSTDDEAIRLFKFVGYV